jgi:hypothetical protein
MTTRKLILTALLSAMLAATAAAAAATGTLKLDVLGNLGAGAINRARIFAADGKQAGEVAPGGTIALPPGEYRLELPIIGGTIRKNEIKIEPGRTHTVVIDNVAVLQVSIKDKGGKDPGFGVTVTATDPPHAKVTTFISGDKVLFAPTQVDVAVDAPPQGYNWHAVALKPGQRARLTLDQVVPAELTVQPVLAKLPIDETTSVTIYQAGTQKRVAESPPGPIHRFELDPGDYDVYVQNNSGKGHPTATVAGVHLDSGAKVTRQVPLD